MITEEKIALSRERTRLWRLAHPGHNKQYYKMTCDERRAYAIKHYAENKDQILAKTKTPDERKRRCENVKRYYSKSQRHLNAVKMREYHASPEYKAWQMACASRRASERRCLELMATPPWVNRLDLFKIYQESSWMTLISGTPHHVDHIWPLKGKGFNGLNVPWNLQILTAKANRSKQNRRPV